MFLTSIKRWKFTTWLLVPVIVGLIFMGAPEPSASGNAFKDEVKALARQAGLESLRVAITVKDGVNNNWTPLLLNPGRVPLPNDLQAYLNSKNKNARKIATQLGKALFWDMAIGSDGMSCASCHFHAGADNRTKNQLHPMLTRFENNRRGDVKGFHFAAEDPDTIFHEPDPVDGTWGPNYTLLAEDFPFVKDIGTGGANGANVDSDGDTINPQNPPNTNDVASSHGVFFTAFESVVQENIYDPFALGSNPVKIRDKGTPHTDPPDLFNVDGVNLRRVEPRHTPTNINAVFNFHQFFDGRANNRFNGVNLFGDTDRRARIFVRGQGRNSNVATQKVRLKNASLASQAVGPPLNQFEMSFGTLDNDVTSYRIWPDIGKKMVGSPFPPNNRPQPRKLLESQIVHPNDSLLGELLARHTDVGNTGRGIEVTYKQLIQDAFNPNLWDSDQMIILPDEALTSTESEALQALGDPLIAYDPLIASATEAQVMMENGEVSSEQIFSLMEANFSFFFGIAVMLYQSELVADQSPFDKFMEGDDAALGNDEILGLLVFINADQLMNAPDAPEFPNVEKFLATNFPDLGGLKDGRCVNCHGGPEFTNASVRNIQGPAGNNLIEPMLMGNNEPAFYDNGFYNIGVTPTTDDRGRGGKGPEDKPLASSRQFLFQAKNIQNINFPIIGAPVRGLVCDPENEDEDVAPSTCDSDSLGFIDEDTGEFFEVCQDLNGDGKCGVEDDIQLQRVAVDGAFKTPSIRNLELHGPYMHNGGFKTLLEVVEFYDRGGNFCKFNFDDLDPDIQPIGFSTDEERGLVAFIIATTDDRVRKKMGPFDHPELRIPNGHTVFSSLIPGQAADDFLTLNAVGNKGLGEDGNPDPPLEAFHTAFGAPFEDRIDGHMEATGVAGGECSPDSK